jgi:uncharacterized membrane protein
MTMLKTIFMIYQVSLDLGMSIASLYMALAITDEYGWARPRERIQMMHRVTFAAVTVTLAWHAVDIIMRPFEHGLTFSNVALHTAFSACMGVAAMRIAQAQRRQSDGHPHTNGDILAGPFSSFGA